MTGTNTHVDSMSCPISCESGGWRAGAYQQGNRLNNGRVES